MKAASILCVLASVCQLYNAAYLDKTVFEALQVIRPPTLVDLIKTANLTGVLNDPNANVTLFAPSERALQRDLQNLGLTLNQLKADLPLLTDVLSYHILPGVHSTSDFTNERVFVTLGGKKLRTNHYVYNNGYYVDGSHIISRNFGCNNGIIHGVSHILYPIKGNVYEIISSDKDLSTLKAAVDAAGLAGFLADQNPITIFAPNNAAFTALGELVQKLLANPDLLKDILAYHVIPGSIYRGGMHDTTLHTFEEADRITLDHHAFGDEVDDARFSKYDISGDNGVVHKITKVMVPESLKSQLGGL